MNAKETLDRLAVCKTPQDVMDLAGEAGMTMDEAQTQAILAKKDQLADADLAGVVGGFGFGVPTDFSATAEQPAFPSLDDLPAAEFFGVIATSL